MWFRNLIVFRIPGWTLDAAGLETALARRAFRNCGALDRESRGWVAPVDGSLVHALERQMLVALRVESKLLPASVVADFAKARADELEEKRGFPPGRKELKEIREQVTDELLPRAFARRRTTHGWIDPVNGWFVVDAGSSARADELVEALRQSLDEFPLAPVRTQISPVAAMTGWLASLDAPAGFSIDRDCELQLPGEDKATVRYLRHGLDSGDVKSHLEAGKQVTRLALTWNDRVSFVLHENLQLKRLAFLDVTEDSGPEPDDEERFDADFRIMTGELAGLLPDLVDALGGEATD